MGRPEEVAALVWAGQSPSEIARTLGINVSTVIDYLHRAIGRGRLRRSDVYFQASPEARKTDKFLKDYFYQPAVFLGDLYQDIRLVELRLHEIVSVELKKAYGRGWWRQGVPTKLREKLAKRRELDEEDPGERLSYCDVLDYYKIMKANWNLFNELLGHKFPNRQNLASSFTKLNRIRNKVMHPSRKFVPAESDFDLVRRLKETFNPRQL